MKAIKRGRLFYHYLEYNGTPDIDRFFLVRAFRKLGIDYIPFTLRFYNRLFLREDKSKYSRKLINWCKKNGIRTYVVQEGRKGLQGIDNPWGHMPLYADYFICPTEDYDVWINYGMSKDTVRTHHPQKPAEDYAGVVFMHPFMLREDYLDPEYWDGYNVKVMEVIHKYIFEDVVFKLHPKDQHIIAPFIPKNRIVDMSVRECTRKYRKYYCFSNSSVCFELKQMGLGYKTVDTIQIKPTYSHKTPEIGR